jgi:hypothetical protein
MRCKSALLLYILCLFYMPRALAAAAAAARQLPTSVKRQRTWWSGASGEAVLPCHSRRLAVSSLGETPGFSESRHGKLTPHLDHVLQLNAVGRVPPRSSLDFLVIRRD